MAKITPLCWLTHYLDYRHTSSVIIKLPFRTLYISTKFVWFHQTTQFANLSVPKATRRWPSGAHVGKSFKKLYSPDCCDRKLPFSPPRNRPTAVLPHAPARLGVTREQFSDIKRVALYCSILALARLARGPLSCGLFSAAHAVDYEFQSLCRALLVVRASALILGKCRLFEFLSRE